MKATVINPNDPRVIKTKGQFMKAFKELVLLYDDYMTISVKELCDRAGLNRKTFYLHYKQVDDLFTEIQDEIINNYYQRIAGLDVFKDVEAIVEAYFEMNESNLVYQKLCLSPHYLYTKEISRKKGAKLYEEKEGVEKLKHNSETIRSYISAFYYYSGYILYSKWVRSNRSMPKEDVIKLVAKLIKEGVSSMKAIDYH